MLFIRLVVNRFKVKIMLLDLETEILIVSVIVMTVVNIIALVNTNIR